MKLLFLRLNRLWPEKHPADRVQQAKTDENTWMVEV